MGGLGSWFQTMWFQTMYIHQQCGDVRMQMISRAGHRGKMDTGGTVHWARGWWFEWLNCFRSQSRTPGLSESDANLSDGPVLPVRYLANTKVVS
jgi:hypothetical protein